MSTDVRSSSAVDSQAGATPPVKRRILWVDAARAIAVLAVVFMHYQLIIINAKDPHPQGATAQWWASIPYMLLPVRMPLLVFVSGLVASRALIGRGRRSALKRAAGSFYLNIVWVSVYLLLGLFLSDRISGGLGALPDAAWYLVTPGPNLWFVYALGLYALIFAASAGKQRVLTFALFLAAAVATLYLPDYVSGYWEQTMRYGVFFAAGVYLAPRLTRELGVKTILAGVVAVILWRSSVGIEGVQEWPRLLRFALIEARACAAIVTAIAICVLLCKIPHLGRLLGRLGERTLPIYVLHLPFLWAVLTLPWLSEILLQWELRKFWPVIGVGAAVAFALLAHAVIMRTPAKYLFKMPERARKARSGA